MTRATKIVATLGPASSDPAVLEQLLRAGVDVVRLNFSHGTAQDHIDRAQLVRDTAVRVGKPVALMADLQGPKIRVGKFAEGKVMLESGAPFVLDAARSEPGDQQAVGLDYKELPRDVKPGDTLLLNDGLIVLTVDHVRGRARAHTGQGRRRVVQQQGHQQARRRPHRAGADRQGHGGHQDRDGLPGRLRGGELPEERHRHGNGAPAGQRGRRSAPPQAGDDRQDRAQRGDPAAREHPARQRRHHGGARRPGDRGRQRGGAGAAETHDPHGARAGQDRSSPPRR